MEGDLLQPNPYRPDGVDSYFHRNGPVTYYRLHAHDLRDRFRRYYVWKRYTDFATFYSQLVTHFPRQIERAGIVMPPKSWTHFLNDGQLELTRSQAFDLFVRKLEGDSDLINNKLSIDFLAPPPTMPPPSHVVFVHHLQAMGQTSAPSGEVLVQGAPAPSPASTPLGNTLPSPGCVYQALPYGPEPPEVSETTVSCSQPSSPQPHEEGMSVPSAHSNGPPQLTPSPPPASLSAQRGAERKRGREKQDKKQPQKRETEPKNKKAKKND